MKGVLVFIWEIVKIVIIALLIVIPIRYFIFQPFLVRGQSMEPNFKNGDYLIVDEISYRFKDPLRGEVIVFKYPHNPAFRYIKRIIGLPGETVEIKDGKVTIYYNGHSEILDESRYLSSSIRTSREVRISLDKNKYFVLGDNRPFSADSRRWGTLPEENIVGRVLFRAWPLDAIAKIEAPEY